MKPIATITSVLVKLKFQLIRAYVCTLKADD